MLRILQNDVLFVPTILSQLKKRETWSTLFRTDKCTLWLTLGTTTQWRNSFHYTTLFHRILQMPLQNKLYFATNTCCSLHFLWWYFPCYHFQSLYTICPEKSAFFYSLCSKVNLQLSLILWLWPTVTSIFNLYWPIHFTAIMVHVFDTACWAVH
jgi:hypothetical protein